METVPADATSGLHESFNVQPDLPHLLLKPSPSRTCETAAGLNAQKSLLLSSLRKFFEKPEHLQKMLQIVNGETHISLRIVDWFVTNYAKQKFVVYGLPAAAPDTTREPADSPKQTRFKVHNEYKLTLKAYQKKNFDPFCRWERIRIPYDQDTEIITTIGQLNFFKWSIENRIIDYIEEHYAEIEQDMNMRNSLAKRRTQDKTPPQESALGVAPENNKTRKKREELSVSACKCIKKENVGKITIRFV